MKVKKIDLVLFLCFFALFKIFAIPTIIQQITKIAIIIMVIIFVVHRQKVKELFNSTLLFCFFIVFSSVYNAFGTGTVGMSNALNGILHGCCIYICFMLITYCVKNNMMYHVIDSLLFILVLYAILSLITIFYNGTSSVKAIYYFAGNKFRTSYYFMLLWSVIYVKCYDKFKVNTAYYIFYKSSFVFLIFFCYWLKCSTAVVGSIVMFLLTFCPDKTRRVFLNWKFIIGSIVGVGVIIIILRQILNMEYVKYFVEEFLGENIKLTGRFAIYDLAFDIVKIRPFFGFGYGNNAVQTYVASYFGNVQNSIIQGVIDYGIFGGLSFVLMIRRLFHIKSNFKVNKDDINRIWGMYIFVFSMIVCAIVEITFGYIFYTALFIVGAYIMQVVNAGEEK